MLLYFDPAQHDEGKAAENQLRTTNKVNTQYFVSSIILNCSSFFRLTRSFWLSSLLYWSLVSCSSAVGQQVATFARCPKAQASSLLCQIRSFVRQGQKKRILKNPSFTTNHWILRRHHRFFVIEFYARCSSTEVTLKSEKNVANASSV